MRQVLVLSLSLLLISGCGVNWKVNIQILRLQSKNMGLRRHAAEVLAGIGPEAKAAVPALIQALRGGNSQISKTFYPTVHCNAADSLVQIGSQAKEVVPDLIQALNDPDESVRYYVAEVLGRIEPKDKSAVPALTQALNDPDRAVRRNAAWALKKINIETEVIEEGDDEFDS